ncbi:MAG: hypothetical protein ACJAU9_001472 [Lentimonas sp.]|jgi:hypothetical protein
MELVIQIARLGEHLKEPAYDLTISTCINKKAASLRGGCINVIICG